MKQDGPERKRRRVADAETKEAVPLPQDASLSPIRDGQRKNSRFKDSNMKRMEQSVPKGKKNYHQTKEEHTTEEVSCAKWCRVLGDGDVEWDDDVVKSFLSHNDRQDRQLMQRIVRGEVVSAEMHPLIFESSPPVANESVRLRSLAFFDELLADTGEDGLSQKYQRLTEYEKKIVAVGIRDMFLASWHGFSSEREEHILNNMVNMLDEVIGCTQVKGMDCSFHPSANCKVVKFIEGLDDIVGSEWKPFFAQVQQTPRLFAVFVDPRELSFHNFENIIPLDLWVESRLEQNNNKGLSVSLEYDSQVHPEHEIFTCSLKGPSCDLIKQISFLDLYVPPLNKATRGGERFIFHSALLSKALTEAVKTSGLLNKLDDDSLASSFAFVNYVFRCNRFAAGDTKFTQHRDTPYYDRTRSHVSRYTLLIYLSPGYGEPALRVQDVDINTVEKMTCVIFNQRYEHEGSPFVEGDKIFLRSELVFTDTELEQNDEIASLFSQACYMTGQSAFDDTLTSYAHECYERANSLHWNIEHKESQAPVYLHKRFEMTQFVTNGYDYWFPKSRATRAVDSGVIAVLDYFNCKIDNRPFRSSCQTNTIHEQFTCEEDVWTYMESKKIARPKPLRRLKEADVEALFRKASDKEFVKRERDWDDGEEDYDEEHDEEGSQSGGGCCPFHGYTTFDAWHDDYVHEVYEKCCNFTREKLLGTPLLILNREIVINEQNIQIIGDKMFFLQDPKQESLAPINFAACWSDSSLGPGHFIDLDQDISTPALLIPPIVIQEFDQGYHLVLDLFRNNWMVQINEERKIPVPVITNEVCMKAPFLRKVLNRFDMDEFGELQEVLDGTDVSVGSATEDEEE